MSLPEENNQILPESESINEAALSDNVSVEEAKGQNEIVSENDDQQLEENVQEVNDQSEDQEETAVVSEEAEISQEENKNEVQLPEIKEEAAVLSENSCDVIEKINDLLSNSSEAVNKELQLINDKLNTLDIRVSKLRKLADMHEAIETDLNAQINRYKDNFYRRIVNPILMEIFDLQEDMCQDRSLSGDGSENILDEYIDTITLILAHYGVEVRYVKEGDTYDPAVHKPLKAVPTDDRSLDMIICKVKKRIVHYIDGEIVERAGVFVYQYKEPEAQASSDDAEGAVPENADSSETETEINNS